ncbi:hypothetical protein ACFX11_028407 [Malus domestica]
MNRDRNTNFFHRRANNRRVKNIIKCLTDKAGNWVNEGPTNENMVLKYFGDLFSSTSSSNRDLTLDPVKPKVSANMNRALDGVQCGGN